MASVATIPTRPDDSNTLWLNPMHFVFFAFALLLTFLALPSGLAQAAVVKPLIRAHSHNDYERARPLLDALDHGFCSVEADIYLIEGQLLVAHDRDKVSKDRTLQALYLDPLLEKVRQNNGRVYRDGPTVILLIDIKSDAVPTYTALRNVLRSYASILTRFMNDRVETNAVTVIISGNRPRAQIAAEPVRHAAIDGRLEDLDSAAPVALIPLVSEDWKRLFKWRGSGPFPPDEKLRLHDFAEKAHRQGKKLRFWGTPDQRAAWEQLFESGVDLLNTDDLAGLSAFLDHKGAKR